MRLIGSLAIVAVLLVACGGNGNNRASTITEATRSPEGTATAAATTTTPSATSPVPTPSPTPRAAVDLSRALLTLDDMPTGWTTGKVSESSGDTKFCNTNPSPTKKALAKAAVAFQRSDIGPFFEEDIALTEPGDAKRGLDSFLSVMQSCQEWSETDANGKVTTYHFSPLSFPKLGDQTVAIRLDLKVDIASAQADLIMFRRGDAAVLVYHAAAGVFMPAVIDSALTEKLARLADQRLQDVLASLGR